MWHRLGKLLASAFQEDDDDVGACGINQGVGQHTLSSIDIGRQLFAFRIIHEIILREVAQLVAQRIEEAEHGIHRRMVPEVT